MANVDPRLEAVIAFDEGQVVDNLCGIADLAVPQVVAATEPGHVEPAGELDARQAENGRGRRQALQTELLVESRPGRFTAFLDLFSRAAARRVQFSSACTTLDLRSLDRDLRLEVGREVAGSAF